MHLRPRRPGPRLLANHGNGDGVTASPRIVTEPRFNGDAYRASLAERELAEAVATERALRRLGRRRDDLLRSVGLRPSQFHVLLEVHAHGDPPLCITSLSELLQLRQPTVTGIVASCERAGLVCRERQPGRRRQALRLTPEGERVLRTAVARLYAATLAPASGPRALSLRTPANPTPA
jgi:DNA-binding MarR family transcriptional regulator